MRSAKYAFCLALFVLGPACAVEEASTQPGAGAGGASGGGQGGAGQAGSAGSAQGGAGSAGASGSAGAGQGGGGGGGAPFQLSEEAKRVMEQAELARQGKPADFDDDGKADYTTSVEGNVVTVEDDTDENGQPEFVYRWDSSSSSGTMAADPDQNGVNDLEISITSKPFKRVILVDDDLDGTFESRVTETYSADDSMIHVKVETLDDNGTFVTEREADISAAKYGGDCTDGVANNEFPLDAPETPIPGTGGRVVIRTNPDGSKDGAKGECSKDHADKIMKAFDGAIKEGLACLKDTNSTAAALLKNALANGMLDISCGNTCSPATTYGQHRCIPVGGETTCQRTRVSFNPKDLDAARDQDNVSKVLHELLHWAGMPDSEDNHGQGTDSLYACARYCGGCVSGQSYTPPGKGITKNTDCAQCANTQERRAKCGLKKIQEASKTNFAVCHSGLGCIAGNCEEPVVEKIKDCADRTVTLGAWCCKACPSDCDGSNDMKCKFTGPSEDKCGGATPHCG